MDPPMPCCVFCHGKSAKIILFSLEALEKSQKILNLRILHKLKYKETVLPLTPDKISGYHSTCYRGFSALMKKYRENIDETLPSSNPHPSTSSQENLGEESQHDNCNDSSFEELRKVCIFCDQQRKSLNGKTHSVSRCDRVSLHNVYAIACEIKDQNMLHKIDENARNDIFYHDICRVSYTNKLKSISEHKTSLWHIRTAHHKEAYDELNSFIESYIIRSGNCIFLSQLSSMFRDILEGVSSEHLGQNNDSYNLQHLETKIKISFSKRIKFLTMHNRKIVVPADGINISDAIFSSLEAKDILQRAALILRKEMLHIERKKLPVDVKVTDITDGECSIPDSLSSFHTTLLGGLDRRRRSSSDLSMKVKSFSHDVIYAVSNGRVKPSKHMSLGITLKSLTSCRKIIDIVNRYGHCCSYNVLEELETELTFAATEKAQVCPPGVSLVPHLSTGVAFDNFDRFVETCNGKDTLHDTVGIIFQFDQSTLGQSEGPPSEASSEPPSKAPGEAPSVLPSEASSEPPSKAPGGAPSEPPGEASSEPPGEASSEPPSEASSEPLNEATSGAPTASREASADETENIDPNVQRAHFASPTPPYDHAGNGPQQNTSPSTSARKKNQKRRRTFDAIIPDVEPYLRKPRMIQTLLPVDSPKREVEPKSLKLAFQLDSIWMILHALQIPDSPMWVGFNSRMYKDESPSQNISYLTHINLSPTNTAVVRLTLVESQRIAEECSQKYIQVTYDLAIAKVAFQIQSTESPQFDNIFIHLGSFHIRLAFFKAIGKFIDNCGLSHMMVDSNLLASGSVNGFITGKHFNRCKRLHPIVSLSLQILHLQSFLERENQMISDDIILELKEIQETGSVTSLTTDGPLDKLLKQYSEYKEKTITGEFGKTLQFYLMYIKLVNYYQLLSRSIRTADFELHKYILPKIANLFFIFNQPNYARWIVKYHDNLLTVDDTHPGLLDELEKGSFGVKRTRKPFSRQPIDLTLEQTINADAARRLTGIVHFTNSISARQRWARSHGIRSSIISHVYDDIRLRKSQDVTSDLEPNKMKKHVALVEDVMKTLKQNMNLFSTDINPDLLFNIATGKAAADTTTDFLLNVESNGNQLRETFVAECWEKPERFELPIKRMNIMNFSAATVKKKVTIAGKVQEVRMQRDLFGRMLGVSMEQNIDIAKVMYPVTPLPMSMCHLDGTICKTKKSAFMNILEKEVETSTPPRFDIVIIDGFFLLHLMKDVPRTFGSISKENLQMATRGTAQRIDIVFDRYFTPSIKDNERQSRDGFQSSHYIISGPEQVRSPDFMNELKNSKFKEALVDFLMDHWASDEIVPFISSKTIFLNHKNCHSYRVSGDRVIRTLEENLECLSHEEADTKMVYHVTQIDTPSNILIKCSDTDVLLIMLGTMEHLSSPQNIWMEIGVGNSLRYLDVTKLHENFGVPLCNALPGLHALTGCDYNPAFYRRGKSKPFKLLAKSPEYQEAFGFLGDTNSTESVIDNFRIFEKFICEMYSVKRIVQVNDARFHLFSTTYKPSTNKEAFKKKMKNFDASNLPPCRAELYQQYLRARYITSIWRNAHCKIPSNLKPEENGWVEKDGKYEFVWFVGDQLPVFVNDIVIQPEESGDDENVSDAELGDSGSDDSDSDTG